MIFQCFGQNMIISFDGDVSDTFLLQFNFKLVSHIFSGPHCINSKKIILENTTNDFEKNENDVFINQYNFQNYLIQNNNNNKKITLYRNILYGLFIAIIVVGIFLYFVS